MSNITCLSFTMHFIDTHVCCCLRGFFASEFSSSRSVFTDAPVLNPYDAMGVAHSIKDALCMKPAQRVHAAIENDKV